MPRVIVWTDEDKLIERIAQSNNQQRLLQTLEAFVRESNRIEGINRDPTMEEMAAHAAFVERKRVTVDNVSRLVWVCQPGAVLRSTTDIPGVRVGKHIAPPSGSGIVTQLEVLLKSIAGKTITPWAAHVEYERLHPFTDGNGRSGRAVWLWHMTLIGEQRRALQLGFLRAFYYQTLAESRGTAP